MSIGNLILGVNIVMVSYLIHYDSLLQNATDIITKCGSYFTTKCDRSLLQNAPGSLFLLLSSTVLLENTTVITNCDNFFTKCDSYYMIRRLLQIATVQYETLFRNDVFLVCFFVILSSYEVLFTNVLLENWFPEHNLFVINHSNILKI